jgi:hypothetical protein
LTVELFHNRQENYFIIRDGDRILKLSEEQFGSMRKLGRSPLLSLLYKAAKEERGDGS